MCDNVYSIEDMREAYEAGYSRATWEEYGGPNTKEELTFREFMNKMYDVPIGKSYLFTWIEVLPHNGRIVKEMHIHAKNATVALEIFNKKVKTHLIIELKFNQVV